jgi:hypothetical protein
MILLLERVLVSWSLAMDERGGHEDLRCSSRRSVISFVHGRTGVVLLKPVLAEFAFSSAGLDRPIFPTPMKRCLLDHFIAQGRVVTMRPRARHVVSRWLKPYTTSRV